MKAFMVWLENHDALGTALTLTMTVFFFALAAVIKWRQDRRERR